MKMQGESRVSSWDAGSGLPQVWGLQWVQSAPFWPWQPAPVGWMEGACPCPLFPRQRGSKSVGRHASTWFSLCRPAQGSPFLIYPEAPASSQKSYGLWIIAVEQAAGGDQGVRLYGPHLPHLPPG